MSTGLAISLSPSLSNLVARMGALSARGDVWYQLSSHNLYSPGPLQKILAINTKTGKLSFLNITFNGSKNVSALFYSIHYDSLKGQFLLLGVPSQFSKTWFLGVAKIGTSFDVKGLVNFVLPTLPYPIVYYSSLNSATRAMILEVGTTSLSAPNWSVQSLNVDTGKFSALLSNNNANSGIFPRYSTFVEVNA
jgi:hypothetical protein